MSITQMGEGQRLPNPLEARYDASLHMKFWSKVDKSGDCWLWTGTISSEGYGRFKFDGVNAMAHRIAYSLQRGVIPAGRFVDHVCRVRSCVRPTHLRLATPKQNTENLGRYSNSKSGIRNVIYVKQTGRWRARFYHNGKKIHVGTFDDIESADRAVTARRNEVLGFNHADKSATHEMRVLSLLDPHTAITSEPTFTLTDMVNIGPCRAEAEATLWSLLPELWANLPQSDNAEDERVYWNQAGRLVSTLLHRDAAQSDVDAALEACKYLYDLENGSCLVHLLGEDNTGENRTRWIEYYRGELSCAIRDMTGAMPERVAA